MNYIEWNCKKYTYYNGNIKIIKHKYSNILGLVPKMGHNGSFSSEQLEKKRLENLQKTKKTIREYALNNEWKYFCTFTFNPKKFKGGYTHDKARLKMQNWLKNLQRKNKNIKYLMVAEFHHESGNVHFHGLFSDVNFTLIQPKKSLENLKIYNIVEWNKIGYNTCTYVNNTTATANYLIKYITKDVGKLKYKKNYWHSKNVKKPIIEKYYSNFDDEFLFLQKKEFANGTKMFYT